MEEEEEVSANEQDTEAGTEVQDSGFAAAQLVDPNEGADDD